MIIPTEYESVPRINDDAVSFVVYLEGSMATNWNEFIESPQYVIPDNLSKYIEFQVNPNYSFQLVDIVPPANADPNTDNSYLRHFYDTYALCRKNAQNLLCPAHPVPVGSWTTLYAQHLFPEIMFLDSFYVHSSAVSTTSFSNQVVKNEMFRFVKDTVYFSCHVVSELSDTALAINIGPNTSYPYAKSIKINPFCAIVLMAQYEFDRPTQNNLKLKLAVVDWEN